MGHGSTKGYTPGEIWRIDTHNNNPARFEAGDTFFPRGIIFRIYAEAQKWKKVQIVAENGGTYWEVATERDLHSTKGNWIKHKSN